MGRLGAAPQPAGRRVPDWTTGYPYVVGELVVNGGAIYRTTTAHTSAGSFNAANFASLSSGSGMVLTESPAGSGFYTLG